MKESEIEIGKCYLVKKDPVSYTMTPVRVCKAGKYRIHRNDGWAIRKLWTGINLETGENVTIKRAGLFIEPIEEPEKDQ